MKRQAQLGILLLVMLAGIYTLDTVYDYTTSLVFSRTGAAVAASAAQSHDNGDLCQQIDHGKIKCSSSGKVYNSVGACEGRCNPKSGQQTGTTPPPERTTPVCGNGNAERGEACDWGTNNGQWRIASRDETPLKCSDGSEVRRMVTCSSDCIFDYQSPVCPEGSSDSSCSCSQEWTTTGACNTGGCFPNEIPQSRTCTGRCGLSDTTRCVEDSSCYASAPSSGVNLVLEDGQIVAKDSGVERGYSGSLENIPLKARVKVKSEANSAMEPTLYDWIVQKRKSEGRSGLQINQFVTLKIVVTQAGNEVCFGETVIDNVKWGAKETKDFEISLGGSSKDCTLPGGAYQATFTVDERKILEESNELDNVRTKALLFETNRGDGGYCLDSQRGTVVGSGRYCDTDGLIKAQKESGEVCASPYECKNNLCHSSLGRCISETELREAFCNFECPLNQCVSGKCVSQEQKTQVNSLLCILKVLPANRC